MLPSVIGKNSLLSIPITIVVVLIGLFAFAQYVRRTSMFVPSRFPEGTWDQRDGAEDVNFTTSDGIRLHDWNYSGGQPSSAVLD